MENQPQAIEPAPESEPAPEPASSQISAWPLMGYAPGSYSGKCIDCDEKFEGDKRALRCLECAAMAANAAIEAAKPSAGEDPKPELKAYSIVLDNGQSRVCRGDHFERDGDCVTIYQSGRPRGYLFRPQAISEQ